MIIELNDIDDFIQEIKSSLNPSIVRVQINIEVENKGVSSVSLTCGFHDESYLYEAKLDCGKDYTGGNLEATNQAKGFIQRIKTTCSELGVECRTGRYQWQS